jgi:quinol monooxygenase YgiN
MKNEVICLSQMTAKRGKEDQLRKALKALVKLTLKEPGCLAYELWQDSSNRAIFIMYERFKDRAALKRHLKKLYIQKFIKNEYENYVESHWDAELQSLTNS